MMLPVYHVVVHDRIFIRTGVDSMKARRLRRNSRASFLVEAGEQWAELRAVHLTGSVTVLDPDDPAVINLTAAMDAKYGDNRVAPERMSEATRAHYAKPRTFLQFEPDERLLSWDNRRIALNQPPTKGVT
jgi:hypothetical protein